MSGLNRNIAWTVSNEPEVAAFANGVRESCQMTSQFYVLRYLLTLADGVLDINELRVVLQCARHQMRLACRVVFS